MKSLFATVVMVSLVDMLHFGECLPVTLVLEHSRLTNPQYL
jgi:hypothetical protein